MPRTKSDKDFISQFDGLPDELPVAEVRDELDSIGRFYGFETLSTPPIEDPKIVAPLARAGLLGERQPILGKTRKGLEILVRPSGALAVLRSYASHKMYDLPPPLKFNFENISCFLAPNKKSEETRCLSEWGLMMIGEEGPIAEAEIIQVIWRALEKLGLDGEAMSLKVNAAGCGDCWPSFRSSLLTYLRGRSRRLCRSCRRHLKRFPTKVLVCQEENCKPVSAHAPQILDFICEVCRKHLRGLLEFLDETQIPYFLDPKFFKEGSWFSTIIFELLLKTRSAEPAADKNQAENSSAEFSEIPAALAEGGRMSRAAELIAGRRTDAACGIAFPRIAAKFCSGGRKKSPEYRKPRVFLTQLGELAKRKSLKVMEMMRLGGIGARESLGRDSVKAQLKVAERLGAEVALILGQKEALDNTIIVREISSGIQETIPQDKLIEFLKRKLKK